ncbi:MazG-like family protein [Streptomyces sp. NPDC047002]|uniref:MazG-like family protein n=1 Tax=Streptomyces sp. NPDC047002 TaxID=3155475 RepID=UPI0034514B67
MGMGMGTGTGGEREHAAHDPGAAGGDAHWAAVERLYGWLEEHAALPAEQERLLRLLKLTEETGEVAAAVIGATGQNPRKGVTHSWADVEAELCDVIVTAMVALRTLTPDAARVFAGHLRRVDERARA